MCLLVLCWAIDNSNLRSNTSINCQSSLTTPPLGNLCPKRLHGAVYECVLACLHGLGVCFRSCWDQTTCHSGTSIHHPGLVNGATLAPPPFPGAPPPITLLSPLSLSLHPLSPCSLPFPCCSTSYHRKIVVQLDDHCCVT